MPANTLAANGQQLRMRFYGTSANNADTKTVPLKFGSAGVVVAAVLGGIGMNWEVDSGVTRTGSATEQAIAAIEAKALTL